MIENFRQHEIFESSDGLGEIFYVYLHRRGDDGSIFYIGKGKEDRAYSQSSRNRYWNHIVKKHGYTVEIVDHKLSENQAFELEIFLIQIIGRHDLGKGRLVNTTDGGEGTSNPSVEVRAKISKHMSVRMIGNTNTLGREMPDHEKVKRAEALIGIKRSDDTKQKMSDAQFGEKNHQFNPEKYKWIHKSGKVEFCTINELTNKYKLKRGHAGELIAGVRLQTAGWFHEEVKEKRPNGNLNSNIYIFRHDEGLEFYGTQNEFKKKYNLDHGKVSLICSGARKKTQGWTCLGKLSEDSLS